MHAASAAPAHAASPHTHELPSSHPQASPAAAKQLPLQLPSSCQCSEIHCHPCSPRALQARLPSSYTCSFLTSRSSSNLRRPAIRPAGGVGCCSRGVLGPSSDRGRCKPLDPSSTAWALVPTVQVLAVSLQEEKGDGRRHVSPEPAI